MLRLGILIEEKHGFGSINGDGFELHVAATVAGYSYPFHGLSSRLRPHYGFLAESLVDIKFSNHRFAVMKCVSGPRLPKPLSAPTRFIRRHTGSQPSMHPSLIAHTRNQFMGGWNLMIESRVWMVKGADGRP